MIQNLSRKRAGGTAKRIQVPYLNIFQKTVISETLSRRLEAGRMKELQKNAAVTADSDRKLVSNSVRILNCKYEFGETGNQGFDIKGLEGLILLFPGSIPRSVLRSETRVMQRQNAFFQHIVCIAKRAAFMVPSGFGGVVSSNGLISKAELDLKRFLRSSRQAEQRAEGLFQPYSVQISNPDAVYSPLMGNQIRESRGRIPHRGKRSVNNDFERVFLNGLKFLAGDSDGPAGGGGYAAGRGSIIWRKLHSDGQNFAVDRPKRYSDSRTSPDMERNRYGGLHYADDGKERYDYESKLSDSQNRRFPAGNRKFRPNGQKQFLTDGGTAAMSSALRGRLPGNDREFHTYRPGLFELKLTGRNLFRKNLFWKNRTDSGAIGRNVSVPICYGSKPIGRYSYDSPIYQLKRMEHDRYRPNRTWSDSDQTSSGADRSDTDGADAFLTERTILHRSGPEDGEAVLKTLVKEQVTAERKRLESELIKRGFGIQKVRAGDTEYSDGRTSEGAFSAFSTDDKAADRGAGGAAGGQIDIEAVYRELYRKLERNLKLELRRSGK